MIKFKLTFMSCGAKKFSCSLQHYLLVVIKEVKKLADASDAHILCKICTTHVLHESFPFIWQEMERSAIIDTEHGAVRSVRYNRDGNYMLTCGSDKAIKLWNPSRQLLIKSYKKWVVSKSHPSLSWITWHGNSVYYLQNLSSNVPIQIPSIPVLVFTGRKSWMLMHHMITVGLPREEWTAKYL